MCDDKTRSLLSGCVWGVIYIDLTGERCFSWLDVEGAWLAFYTTVCMKWRGVFDRAIIFYLICAFAVVD